MSETIKATYENGVLKPKEPLALKEGTEVDLTLTTPPGEDDPLAGVIGIGNSGRTDGAEQHDHYIYGTPSANDLRLRSSVRLGVRR
jgi:predicted DNA-binding antitoxin AbrB/MazE fold protein